MAFDAVAGLPLQVLGHMATIIQATNLFKSVMYPFIIDDDFVALLVAHVTERVRSLELPARRRKAQALIEATAAEAICEMWTAAFRGTFRPTKSWPIVTAILLDKPRRVVMELWIGHEYHAVDSPEPLEIHLDGE